MRAGPSGQSWRVLAHGPDGPLRGSESTENPICPPNKSNLGIGGTAREVRHLKRPALRVLRALDLVAREPWRKSWPAW
eukprot:13546064-Alexandrium_andersonii.AAC.1